MKAIDAIIDSHDVHDNALLSALLARIDDRLDGHLTLVELNTGAVLPQTRRADAYVYFPNDALISVLSVIENGKSAEIGIVGSEGLVGIEGLTGGRNPYVQAKVQSAGTAFRVPTRRLRDEFNSDADTRWLILRHMQSMLAQISQAVTCARHHSIEQQLCRKLLMSSDRLRGNTLALTQTMIAELLGVRREGVTAAAGELRNLGVIEYHRGHIRILDRATLEARSCECYEVIKTQCDGLWRSVSALTERPKQPLCIVSDEPTSTPIRTRLGSRRPTLTPDGCSRHDHQSEIRSV